MVALPRGKALQRETQRHSVVPLARITSFGPLPELVANWESERALQRLLQSEGLSHTLFDHPELYVPYPAMTRIFQRAARSVAGRDFGLRVGDQMNFQGYGLWAQYCVQAPTLGEAMIRLCETVRFQSNAGFARIEREGNYAVVRYRLHDNGHATIQYSDHLMPPLLRFFRRYLGHDWNPAWIELDYPRDAQAHVIEALLPSPVRFGQGVHGMPVRVEHLSQKLPVNLSKPVTLLDVEASGSPPNPGDLLGSAVSIAILRLMDGRTDIDGTADMVGTSVRTLQRCLNEEGLSHRELVTLVRSMRAKALLSDTELTITEVALALGYSEHANFTRAFNRWAGCSPADYRRFVRAKRARRAKPNGR